MKKYVNISFLTRNWMRKLANIIHDLFFAAFVNIEKDIHVFTINELFIETLYIVYDDSLI